MNPLDLDFLRERFSASGIRLEIYYKEETGSTNDLALEYCEKISGNAIFLTEHQTRGKGSKGREWKDFNENSLAFSISVKSEINPERIPMITLLAGMAVIRAIDSKDVKIKWPNDVVYNGKKLCGILTTADPSLTNIVVGIGINVLKCDLPKTLEDRAVSLEEMGIAITREELLSRVTAAFFELFHLYRRTEDLRAVKDEYNEMLVHRDNFVEISGNMNIKGISRGIDSLGRLIVEDEKTGSWEYVQAGEVSVDGIYKNR